MTRILDVCFFSSAKDNRPASHPMGVDALEAAFRDAVKGGLVEVPPTQKAKEAGPAFSPCRYPPRTTRAKDSVEVVTAFVMDLDNVDDAFVDEVFANLASVGVRAFGWSTWGSGWKKLPQSWRVVVPFAVDVDAADWPAVWLALSERLALGRNDVSTKNADRLHFVPNAPFMVPDGKGGERLNEPIRWRSLQGALFDPSSVVEESRLALSPKPTSGSRIVDVFQPPSLDLGLDPLGLDFDPVPRVKPKVDEEKVDVKALADDVRKRQPDDCSALAGSLGMNGKSRRWLCPSSSCKGKTEATLSTPEAGGWTCFRCGAKGDALALVGIAQGHTLPLRGRDFVDVLTWLAAHIGVTQRNDVVTPVVTLAVKPALTPSAIAAEWNALESRQTGDSAATQWLLGRGISAQLVRSGFAVLDSATVGALRDAPAIGWLRYNVGAAIVAPLRSLRTGDVCALQGRVFKVSDPKYKRAVVGQLRDGDKTHRVFGDVKNLRPARIVVLVEGMADTWAGEALTAGVDGVVVIGADSADAIPDVAERVKSARVVIVRHLDRPDVVEVDKQGVGQKKAREALEALGRRGSAFLWPDFRRAMLALGVDTRPTPPGFDLAAALELTHAAGVDFAAVQRAFLAAIGEAGKLPGLVAPKPSPLRVSAPPVPPVAKAHPPTEPVAPVGQSPTRGPVDDVGEGRHIARTELAAVGWTDDETEDLTATIDRLWGSQ